MVVSDRRSPLRLAGFRNLAAAYTINQFGDWIGDVALAILIFDRTGKWPGVAEKHGIDAVIDLLVERHVINDVTIISTWLHQHATINGRPCNPDIYAPCPCGSGKRLKFCHRDDLQPLFKRLMHILDLKKQRD